MTTPAALLKKIKEWNSIAPDHQAFIHAGVPIPQPRHLFHRWEVRDGAIHRGTKEQQRWIVHIDRKQSLAHVFRTMHDTLDLVPVDTIRRHVHKGEWQKHLKTLDVHVMHRSEQVGKYDGSMHWVLRSLGFADEKKSEVAEERDRLVGKIRQLRDIGHEEKEKKRSQKQRARSSLVDFDAGLQLFSTPKDKDLRPMLCAAFEQAMQSITMFAYSITDKKIMQALESRAARGVRVTVLHDKNAFKYASMHFSPNIILKEMPSKGLMHLKIITLDGRHVIYGSANFTTEGLTKDRNLMTAVDCMPLAHMINEKARSVLENRHFTAPQHHYTLKGKRQLDFYFLPESAMDARRQFLSWISTAKKTLDIAIFTWTDKTVADKVIELYQRKVAIRAVIDGQQAHGAGKAICQLLQSHGVPITIAAPNRFLLTHHKFACIDGSKIAHGSANWTEAAEHINNDCISFIGKPTKQDRQAFQEMFDSLLQAVNTPKKQKSGKKQS